MSRKFVLDVAWDKNAVRNAKDSSGGLAVRVLGLVIAPAPHGEEAHFTVLRQGCSESGSCQKLRPSDVQADDGRGRAQHGADNRLGEGVDGDGVLGGSSDHHHAARLLIHCKMNEMEWPRESATQS